MDHRAKNSDNTSSPCFGPPADGNIIFRGGARENVEIVQMYKSGWEQSGNLCSEGHNVLILARHPLKLGPNKVFQVVLELEYLSLG